MPPECLHTYVLINNAFIGIKAEHPLETQLLLGTLQEELPMPVFGRSARSDIGFPHSVGQDHDDLRVTMEQLQRPVRARVIIGDDRIDVSADIIKGITQDQLLVANAGDANQKMRLSQKLCIARNHPLGVAQLPRDHVVHCLDLKHVKRRALNLRPRRDISRELLPPPHHRPRSRAPEPRDELPPSHS